jgi:hypothetical protein
MCQFIRDLARQNKNRLKTNTYKIKNRLFVPKEGLFTILFKDKNRKVFRHSKANCHFNYLKNYIKIR